MDEALKFRTWSKPLVADLMLDTLVQNAFSNMSDVKVAYPVAARHFFMHFLRFRLDDRAFNAKLVWCCREALAHAAKAGTPFALFEGHLVRKSHNFHGEQTMDSSLNIYPISRSSERDINLTVLSTEAREMVEAGNPPQFASLTLAKDSARETK